MGDSTSATNPNQMPLCPPYSAPPSEMMSSLLCTPLWLRTEDRLTVSSTSKVTSTPLNLGVLVALSPVFPEFLVPVPTDPVRPLSVTCAVRDACSLPSAPGENGTRSRTSPRRDTPLPPLSPPLPALPSLW